MVIFANLILRWLETALNTVERDRQQLYSRHGVGMTSILQPFLGEVEGFVLTSLSKNVARDDNQGSLNALYRLINIAAKFSGCMRP